jgi:CheY-like chemotaxis protein
LLKRLGYRVQEASSGEDGLRLAQCSQEKINLLITDILMPGMSGRELARALLARDTSLKVLFLSGHTGDPPSFVAFRLYYAAPARRPLQEDDSPN